MDGNANFSNIWLSMMVLTRAETGESWNSMMHDTMVEKGWPACFYWLAFIIIKVHILLNVVIAVIFDKLEEKAV